MAKSLIAVLAAVTLATMGPPSLASTCVGADPCRACHTCEYCKRCAGRGLKCGVCKGTKSKQTDTKHPLSITLTKT